MIRVNSLGKKGGRGPRRANLGPEGPGRHIKAGEPTARAGLRQFLPDLKFFRGSQSAIFDYFCCIFE